MSDHPFVHIEIPAENPLAAGKFYQQLFHWKTEDVPQYDYVTFDADKGLGGGFPRIDGQTYKPNDVIVYIGTDDIDTTLQRIEALGGKTLLPKSEIPGIGWYAFFSDPTGNRLALFTGNPMPGGAA